MPNEPLPKVNIVIFEANTRERTIMFHAPELNQIFAKFGYLESNAMNRFRTRLLVDPRYDFQEVLAYLRDLRDHIP